MGRIYSYHYLNQYADVASIPAPALATADVLEVSRNGIGMLPGTYANETVVTDVLMYSRRSSNSNQASANKYIIQISNAPSTTDRVVVYEFGSLVEIGDVYRFEINPLFGVEYTVQSGDTVTDVRNEVKTLIDATTWPGVSISSSSVSTNRLQLTYNNFYTQLNPYIVYGTKYLYQKGYYVVIAGKEYLVINSNSNTTYPTLPAIAATYDFGDLTYMPAGVEAYINNPSYVREFYQFSIEDATSILDVPTAGSLGQGRYLYSETEQKLTFAEALQPGEYIKMLYK